MPHSRKDSLKERLPDSQSATIPAKKAASTVRQHALLTRTPVAQMAGLHQQGEALLSAGPGRGYQQIGVLLVQALRLLGSFLNIFPALNMVVLATEYHNGAFL